MDNSSSIALAAALEIELTDLYRQLKALVSEVNPQDFETDLNQLMENLPTILSAASTSTYAANALKSILATNYAKGVAEAAGIKLRNVGELMRPEKAYASIRESGVLRGAPNTLLQAEQAIEVRANALSKIIKGQLVQDLRDALIELEGEGFEGAKDVVKKESQAIEELSENKHVTAHVEAQSQLAKGYGTFSVQQTDSYLRSVPFQEFYRAEHRSEWRNWPDRWSGFGGRFYAGPSDYPEGRMIAETNSKIWDDLSDPDKYSDATGSPYPPFAYNSGMGVKPVTLAEAKKLGLLGAHHKPAKPRKLDFNAGIAFSADFDDDLKSALMDSLHDWVEQKGEVIHQ